MNARATDRAGTAALAVAALAWGTAFVLACRLDDRVLSAGERTPAVFDRLAGTLRADLSERLYLRADRYFHAGGSHHDLPPLTPLLDRWRDDIRPREPRHVEGVELAEIMPWLRWATAVDPAHVEPFLVAGYWMDGELGRPDLAERIFREAARRHPRDYRVALDWGRSRARRGEFEAAARLLGSAQRLWPSPLEPDDAEAMVDGPAILELRGFLLLQTGDTDAALDVLRRALALRPQSEGLQDWIERIASGESLEESIERLRTILRAAERSFDGDECHDHAPPASCTDARRDHRAGVPSS